MKELDKKDTIKEIINCERSIQHDINLSNTQPRMMDIIDAIQTYYDEYQENILPEAQKQGFNIDIEDLLNNNIIFYGDIISDEVFNFFVEAGINVNQKNNKNKNLLFFHYKNPNRIKKLLDYSINPLVESSENLTVIEQIEKDESEIKDTLAFNDIQKSIDLINKRIINLKKHNTKLT